MVLNNEKAGNLSAMSLVILPLYFCQIPVIARRQNAALPERDFPPPVGGPRCATPR